MKANLAMHSIKTGQGLRASSRALLSSLTAGVMLLTVCGMSQAGATLDNALDAVAPQFRKWAVVCVVREGKDGAPAFDWHDYRGTADRKDFWPASAIKLYAVIAALELLHEKGCDLDTTAIFEHQEKDGRWVLDTARTMREMMSEVFRRSSNEDYTLLLRLVGVDWMNTHFLTAERGFPNSALMRGYVKGKPWEYVREERQRVRLVAQDGARSVVLEHVWSGRAYAQERGCTIIDAKTGNVTTPREMADCLRRVMFHERLREAERFRISAEQLRFLREGGGGLTGLETTAPESGPSVWARGAEEVFPKARYFHKSGMISNYALDLACVDDSANGGPCYIAVPVIAAGHATKAPDGLMPAPLPPSTVGETLVGRMSLEIAKWVKNAVR
jgi:hypothetical protein